jgi:hypothetical protein
LMEQRTGRVPVFSTAPLPQVRTVLHVTTWGETAGGLDWIRARVY